MDLIVLLTAILRKGIISLLPTTVKVYVCMDDLTSSIWNIKHCMLLGNIAPPVPIKTSSIVNCQSVHVSMLHYFRLFCVMDVTWIVK